MFTLVGATAILAGVNMALGAGPAFAFGSTDLLGQHSEHQHITESLTAADPLWQPNSLKLVAGSAGNFGAVAAPDRPTDSSATPLVGLGPGYKHCDNGDWLDTPGYPQSKSAAVGELEKCGRYYQYLLDRAVRYAGQIVSPDLKVNSSVFSMTKGSSISPDSVCAYRFSLAPDSNPKCDVINAFGRSLHLAEDVWSHTNWADEPDPARQIGVTNPPGLGNTEIPDFLRYPAAVVIPEGLISGCDDSLPLVPSCKGQVTHGTLAKDNGTFDPDGANAQATSKYQRGTIVVDGVTNFQRAITGARKQVASTWNDLQAAIVSKYGDQRGNAIVAVLRSDSLAAAGINGLTETDQTLARSAPAGSGEFAADPANDAPLGSGDKEKDAGHSGLEPAPTENGSSAATSAEREAAAVDVGAPEAATNAVDAADASGNSPMLWWLVAIIVVVVILAMFVLRRRRTRNNP